MLTDAQPEPVVPVSDLDRSIPFYRDTLGLELLEQFDDIPDNPEARFRAGGGTLAIYKSVGAGQARHTVAAFVVDDIESTVRQLRDAGVAFEDYDLPGLKTENGIATTGGSRGAWFRDPDGNILAVAQYA